LPCRALTKKNKKLFFLKGLHTPHFIARYIFIAFHQGISDHKNMFSE